LTKYLFSDEEIELIKFLAVNNPKRIWIEPISYIFEYDSFYLELGIKLAEKFFVETILSFNTGESHYEKYVMQATIKQIDSTYQPQELSVVVYEEKNISKISIARTLLYFTKPTQSKEHINSYNDIINLINPEIPLLLDAEKKFLVDVGLLIHIDDKDLNCFILQNNDDFEMNGIIEDLEREKPRDSLYQFIEI
jgi:hypothetical protein